MAKHKRQEDEEGEFELSDDESPVDSLSVASSAGREAPAAPAAESNKERSLEDGEGDDDYTIPGEEELLEEEDVSNGSSVAGKAEAGVASAGTGATPAEALQLPHIEEDEEVEAGDEAPRPATPAVEQSGASYTSDFHDDEALQKSGAATPSRVAGTRGEEGVSGGVHDHPRIAEYGLENVHRTQELSGQERDEGQTISDKGGGGAIGASGEPRRSAAPPAHAAESVGVQSFFKASNEIEDRVQQAKRMLDEQKAATGALRAGVKAADDQHRRELEGMQKRIGEAQALCTQGPNQPGKQAFAMLQRVRAKRALLSKRAMLLHALKHTEAHVAVAQGSHADLTRKLGAKLQDIERKRRQDEEGLQDKEIEQQTFELSELAVEEGKRNLELSHKLIKAKTHLQVVEEDVTHARLLLWRALRTKPPKKTKDDVRVEDLLERYLEMVEREEEHENAAATAAADRASGGSEVVKQLKEDDGLREMERSVKQMQLQTEDIEAQIQSVEVRLQAARAAWQDVHALKGKVAALKRRYLAEKEERIRAQQGKKGAHRKIVLLSEHIEKLMVHIKHEAVAKARAQARRSRAIRELKLLRRRSVELVRKMHEREELIHELKKSARLLEDQLKLMDNKYVELRGKLDYIKSSSEAEVRRAQDELQMLCEKMDFVRSLFPGHDVIDPQELKHVLFRYSTNGLPSITFDAQGLPSIQERPSPTRATKHRRRRVQYEYPSISTLIHAPDPEDEQGAAPSSLWSSAKIEMLKESLKHYNKSPVKTLP